MRACSGSRTHDDRASSGEPLVTSEVAWSSRWKESACRICWELECAG